MAQLVMRLPTLDSIPSLPVPEGYEVRAFLKGEEASLAQCMSLADGPGWDEERARREITEARFVRKTIVVIHEGEIVATTSAAHHETRFPGVGYIHWVAASPDHQGKKLGSICLIECLKEFKRLGFSESVLETDAFRLPAIRSYLRLGYVPDLTHPPDMQIWAELTHQFSS